MVWEKSGSTLSRFALMRAARASSGAPVALQRLVVDLVQVDDDVVRGAAGQPDQLLRRGHVALDVRHVRRDEHEVALLEVLVLGVVLAEPDPPASLEDVAAGLGLTVVVRER